MNSIRTHLLIIDPQNDFCDLPESYWPAAHGAMPACAPALPVPGAHQDLLRLARWIDAAGSKLSAISVTLDSHQHFDIGHPTFWQGEGGALVSPFTQVTASDVRSGRFVPRRTELIGRVTHYLAELEAKGRYVHMVWPVHCEIGTWGQGVHDDLRLAYNRWEEATLNVVNKITKGKNPYTEHYSAVQAEVPDPEDRETQLNTELIAALKCADVVYIAGEAGSHCVKATTEHLVMNFSAVERARLVLLTDCMSPVFGFEDEQTKFLSAMREAGLRTLTAEQALSDLKKTAAVRSQ
jgi:nicotinamidase/pyrazinamidase